MGGHHVKLQSVARHHLWKQEGAWVGPTSQFMISGLNGRNIGKIFKTCSSRKKLSVNHDRSLRRVLYRSEEPWSQIYNLIQSIWSPNTITLLFFDDNFDSVYRFFAGNHKFVRGFELKIVFLHSFRIIIEHIGFERLLVVVRIWSPQKLVLIGPLKIVLFCGDHESNWFHPVLTWARA